MIQEVVMSAKYNRFVDNFGVRVALNTAGFVLWLVASMALLRA